MSNSPVVNSSSLISPFCFNFQILFNINIKSFVKCLFKNLRTGAPEIISSLFKLLGIGTIPGTDGTGVAVGVGVEVGVGDNFDLLISAVPPFVESKLCFLDNDVLSSGFISASTVISWRLLSASFDCIA
ncbi:unnamed protein product [[Candida] boidinii]|nr:unnamed protein product [[Candida] boidinii]